jgi:hypothetical protein
VITNKGIDGTVILKNMRVYKCKSGLYSLKVKKNRYLSQEVKLISSNGANEAKTDGIFEVAETLKIPMECKPERCLCVWDRNDYNVLGRPATEKAIKLLMEKIKKLKVELRVVQKELKFKRHHLKNQGSYEDEVREQRKDAEEQEVKIEENADSEQVK